MFAVIFEVQPRPDRWDEYLGIASMLRPEIQQIDGFIDNERFRSRRTEGRLLSLSTWRDEKSVIRWRTHVIHHGAQERGRFEVFQDYHLRVGEVATDTHIPSGQEIRTQRLDDTEAGAAKLVTITEALPGTAGTIAVPPDDAPGLVDAELFDSIYTEGKMLALVSWQDSAAASHWKPGPGTRHRAVRIIRDYGMKERREAPQYYPAIP